MKKICLLVLLTVSALTICAQKKFVLTSPDGVLKAYISIGKEITYSVTHGTDTVLFQSAIAMQLDKGRTFGIASRLSGHNEKAVRQYLKSPFYKKKEIEDHYNLIHLKFKNGFNLEFRAYNEGIAYRFISTLGEAFTVENEIATFNLGKDRKAFIPYVRKNVKTIEEQFYNTFENVYTYQAISEWKHGQLSLMPLAIELDHGKKVCITEADLENSGAIHTLFRIRTYSNNVALKPFSKIVKVINIAINNKCTVFRNKFCISSKTMSNVIKVLEEIKVVCSHIKNNSNSRCKR